MPTDNRYMPKEALCPYYKREYPQMIYCKGVVKDGLTHVTFATRSVAYAYKKAYCRDRYDQCHIYRMLEGIKDE